MAKVCQKVLHYIRSHHQQTLSTPPSPFLLLLALFLIATPSAVHPAAAAPTSLPSHRKREEGGSQTNGGSAGRPRHTQQAQPQGVVTKKAYADKVYIVVMDDKPPLSQLTGGDNSFSASSSSSSSSSSSLSSVRPAATGGQGSSEGSGFSSNLNSAQAHAYSASLASSHVNALASAGVRASARISSMTFALNGFGAVLTPQEASRVRSQPGVASVERSRIYYPQVLDTPEYLRLDSSVWPMAGGRDSAGENVIIGVVDTGIWPEHPSFSDKVAKGYGPLPAKWRGSCSTGPDFPTSLCNRKLIGANFFLKGYQEEFPGPVDTSADYNSPRDGNGHGTWCASAAGGNAVNMTYQGSFVGMGSGMAPRARIASYKVCWNAGTTRGSQDVCMGLDILLALDKAMSDGVDIISMSLGGRGPDDFFGGEDQLLLRMALNGVVTATSAGNSGEYPQFIPWPQTGHNAPWYFAVAASTIPTPTVMLTLGNGWTMSGRGWVSGNSNTRSKRVVLSINCAVDVSAGGLDNADYCYLGSLSAAKCSGAIIACFRGGNDRVEKSKAVAQAGGAGIIILSHPFAMNQPPPETYAVPGCLLLLAQSDALQQYIRSTGWPTVTIETNAPAPAMATFSSRGPVVNPRATSFSSSGPSPHILKPDITAPGVNLLSAVKSPSLATRLNAQYTVMSGTSMATPHVAGLAAMMKQLRPSWSAARIKSAMMTTATVRDSTGGPIKMQRSTTAATPFSYGAGHVNPSAMTNPGLVYDAGQADYYNFLAGMNSNRANQLPGVTFSSRPTPTQGYNLNQPYICVAQLRGSVVVTRRVTNVASTTLVFNSVVETPSGVNVAVTPQQLPTLAPGASTSFSVRLTVTSASPDYRFGSLTWFSTTGGFSVRSPIVVQPVSV